MGTIEQTAIVRNASVACMRPLLSGVKGYGVFAAPGLRTVIMLVPPAIITRSKPSKPASVNKSLYSPSVYACTPVNYVQNVTREGNSGAELGELASTLERLGEYFVLKLLPE